MSQQPSATLILLAELALRAGQKIMEIYETDFNAELKHDNSPVTQADVAAEAIILSGLSQIFPNIPVIAEEQVASGIKTSVAEKFFLVDPLDGTKEFISKNGEFTVNIGLIENGAPIMGVVYAPALDEMFMGEMGQGAWCGPTKIQTRPCPAKGAVILASRSHLDEATKTFIAAQLGAEISNAGSSLKFCRVAQGKADLYPRFGRTMEWDTAAGHAVLAAAGGKVTNPDGTPFTYGKTDFANGPFIARGV